MLELARVDKGQSTELRQRDLCRRGVVARARGGWEAKSDPQLGQMAITRQKFDLKKTREIDWSYLCQWQFEKFWTYIQISEMKITWIWWFFFCKNSWHDIRKLNLFLGRFLAIWDHCATKGCCTGKLWRRSSSSWQSSLYRFKQRRRQHQDQVVQRLRPREVQGGEGGLGREGRKALRTITAVLCVYSEHTHTSTTRFLLLLRPLWPILKKKLNNP